MMLHLLLWIVGLCVVGFIFYGVYVWLSNGEVMTMEEVFDEEVQDITAFGTMVVDEVVTGVEEIATVFETDAVVEEEPVVVEEPIAPPSPVNQVVVEEPIQPEPIVETPAPLSEDMLDPTTDDDSTSDNN